MQAFGMVFEDAGVLGKLFSHLQAKEQIPSLLYGFQDIRQDRCRMVIEREKRRTAMFILQKGPEQQERDDQIRKHNKVSGADLGLYSLEEPEKLFSYECDDQGEEWWHSWGLLHNRTHYIEEDPDDFTVKLEVEVKALAIEGS
jgi:salicylate hydroxylase